MRIYALTLQGVFNSLEPHAHGEAQVDDFWQKMISRQCLQSQVTGTPWNCFLRRASTNVCYCATSCHYAHLCSDVARSVQQSGATCSWWSTGGWFLTKNDITTVSSVAGNWHTLKLLLASCVNKRLLLCHILPLCASMPIYALTPQVLSQRWHWLLLHLRHSPSHKFPTQAAEKKRKKQREKRSKASGVVR